MNSRILLAGIGGQGVLFVHQLLADCAVSNGHNVTGAETHGMSQRGGSVVSHLKVGDGAAPLIRQGTADWVLGFDESEAYRNLPFVRSGGGIIVNTPRHFPSESLQAMLDKHQIRARRIDADGLARKLGRASAANIALLGFACTSAAFPFSLNEVRLTVRQIARPQTLEDATGLGHTAQLGSSLAVDTLDPTWTTGLTGGALRFDGSKDRVLVADAPHLHLNSSFTIEAWIQRSKFAVEDCVLSKGDSNKRNFWLMLDTSNRIEFRWQSSGPTDHITLTTATITDAAWHHIACVYDKTAGQDRVYLDGILVQQRSDSGTPVTDTAPVYIGARLLAGSLKSWFHGNVDLVRLSPSAVYTADFANLPGNVSSVQVQRGVGTSTVGTP